MNPPIKLALRTIHLQTPPGLEGEIHRRLLDLNNLHPISTAHVLLSRDRDGRLPFSASVHLEVPGPDLTAAAWEHTLAAALLKVERDLKEQIALRHSRRFQNQKNRRKVRAAPRPHR